MASGTHVLVTGGTGQVGLELLRAGWPEAFFLHAPTRAELDLTDAGLVRRFLNAHRFSAVINCAAWTAVDKAETDVAAAYSANAIGPALLAEITRELGIPLIQVSTDYVFNGEKPAPYLEDDPVGPIGVYGASKLAGEFAVRLGNPNSVVLRTAWVLSPHGNNFLKTMLRLASARPTLRVVNDQYGCPTSAADIADTLKTITLRMIFDENAPTGIYHFVNRGTASWADLASEIIRLDRALGGPNVEVVGIPSSDYPTPARRPQNSSLSTEKLTRDYGVRPGPWREAVEEILMELRRQSVRSLT